MAITKDLNGMVDLDSSQVIRTQAEVLEDGSLAQKVINVAGNLVPKVFNKIEVSYIVSGNGIGEPGQVTYKLNLVTVAVLNLSYDSSNRIISVERT